MNDSESMLSDDSNSELINDDFIENIPDGSDSSDDKYDEGTFSNMHPEDGKLEIL